MRKEYIRVFGRCVYNNNNNKKKNGRICELFSMYQSRIEEILYLIPLIGSFSVIE